MLLLRIRQFALALLLGLAFFGPAQAEAGAVQTAWRLLDYVAVDYGGAVADGRVISVPEYAEMTEFSASIHDRIAALPPTAARGRLVMEAAGLQRAVADKQPPEAVARQARTLAAALLAAYPVALAPVKAPDPARGAQLYAQHCASCHGLNGDGHGPDAAKLDPPPIAFADVDRARERSLFALYQVIEQGLDGTAMQSFAELPAQDRWALAIHAGSFAFGRVTEGERLWKSDPALRARFPDLAALTSVTPTALSRELGQERADAVIAYLRAHPEAVVQASAGSLTLTRDKLRQSLAAYRAGDHRAAENLALSAYLDGFEPLEPMLTARDPTLMARIEGAMGELRATIGRGAEAETIATQIEVLDSLFADAEAILAPGAESGISTFLGAFTVLLREGLEALLIVVAMIAFLRRADRRDVLPYVHGGWVAALLAGAATWAAATFLIGVSGASRELTEGFGSLFAAVVLLSVGIWMHGKSRADQWQRYIQQTLGKALSGSSAWFLFALAFLVVYREVFETILFYAALSTQGNGVVVLAGAGTGAAVLAIIAWVMLRYSRQLPIGKFFAYSSALIAALAVVLAGKGVAALQEAGLIDIRPLSGFPRITILGVFPAAEPLVAQFLILAIVAVGFWYNSKRPVASAQTAAE